MTMRKTISRTAPAASTRRRFKNSKWENKFKAKVVRLKREMEEIGEEQRLIGEQQREIRGRLQQISEKCMQIRQESELISKQQASNQILLRLMFQILRARDNGDFLEAAKATSILREVMAKANSTGN